MTDSTILNQITLGQAAIEQVYIDNLAEYGVSIERPIVPISIVHSTDPEELGRIDTHPVEVRLSSRGPLILLVEQVCFRRLLYEG